MLMLQAIVFLSIGQTGVNQIVLGNGGIFNNTTDHVMITGINPVNFSSSPIGEVIRESIQDLIVVGEYAFVAAEDSLVKFNLNTQVKETAIYHGNLSRLYHANEQIFVSMRSDLNGPPADGKYLKAFDMDLNLLFDTDGISTDAGGMIWNGDSLYIAVSGDWQASEGKLAVANSDLSFVRELNLGADAVGIIDLFSENHLIYAVNKSPYGATSGSITTYDVTSSTWNTQILQNVVGKGINKVDNLLYLGLDYGIGAYDLNTSSVMNNQIISDPGSASYINIAAAVFDEINERFYVTITDYFSMGEGAVYDINGLEIGNFDASVSAEAMAIQYSDETSISNYQQNQINVYPNPCQDLIHISSAEDIDFIEIFNESGQLIKSISNANSTIKLADLTKGIYILKIHSLQSVTAKKIFKQ